MLFENTATNSALAALPQTCPVTGNSSDRVFWCFDIDVSTFVSLFYVLDFIFTNLIMYDPIGNRNLWILLLVYISMLCRPPQIDIHLTKNFTASVAAYHVDLIDNGPIVKGANITFKATLYDDDNNLASGSFKYGWVDTAVPVHSREVCHVIINQFVTIAAMGVFILV